MKILHLTDQLSKKNYSISSLIIYISSIKSFSKKDISIASSKFEKKFFRISNDVSIISVNNWVNFFSSKLNKFNFVHVHGIWSLLQILTVLFCVNKKTNVFVHPHGMLLHDALKSGGWIKYILKLTSLGILSFFFQRVNFIAITNQEKLAIRYFFKKSKIFLIENPIPFKKYENLKTDKKEKKIVYFGRIHPHKNLNLLIDSFIEANLDSNWKLYIYGIPDDENYLSELRLKVKDLQNVFIKEPIFGSQKIKEMNTAWMNVLLSKSEVLSLSILEASNYGLPTLICSSFDTDQKRMFIYKSSMSKYDIAKKFRQITSWDLKKRLNLEKNFLANKYSNNLIDKKYDILYDNKFSLDKKITKSGKIKNLIFNFLSNSKKVRFFIYSISYLINFILPSLFLILAVIVNKNSLAAEIGIVSGFWITLTQVLSSNIRIISISSKDILKLRTTLLYRFGISIISIFIFYYFSSNLYNFENTNILNSICFLILMKWTNEMLLAQSEIKNKFRPFLLYLSINIVFILIILFCFFYSNFDLLEITINFLSGFLFLNIIRSIYVNSKFISFSKIRENVVYNLTSSAFTSSLGMISSSFLWRLFIFNYFSKSISGLIFAAFSIGSFPGTLFNSIIGPIVVRDKIKLPEKYWNFFKIVFGVLLILSIYFYYNLVIDFEKSLIGKELFYLTLNLSLLGSFFMCFAMYHRHKQIFIGTKQRDKVLKIDTLYGVILIFIVPILYFLFGLIGVIFSFLTGSILAFLIYKNYHNYKLYIF